MATTKTTYTTTDVIAAVGNCLKYGNIRGLNMRMLVCLVFLPLLAACGTSGINPGTYHNDGLGQYISIHLNSDGTYTAEWDDCLGEYDKSEGTWQVKDSYVRFNPSEENGIMGGRLKQMKIVWHWLKKGLISESELNECKKTIKKHCKSFNFYTPKKP